VYLLLGLIWGAIALEYRHQRLLRPVLPGPPGITSAPARLTPNFG
jgi:hypothetical protein